MYQPMCVFDHILIEQDDLINQNCRFFLMDKLMLFGQTNALNLTVVT